MRRFLLLFIPLVGCQTVTSQNANNLDRPEEMIIVCTSGSSCALPLNDVLPCDSDDVVRQCGLITNGARADLAVADLGTGLVIDNDRRIPGFTRIPLPGQPGSVTVSAEEESMFVALQPSASTKGSLLRMGIGVNAEEDLTQELGEQPGSITLSPSDSEELWIALPDSNQVTILPLDDFGQLNSDELETIPVSGSPGDLSFTSDGGILLVAYNEVAHISAIDVASRTVIWHAPIAPRCMDGFDNDGDGLIDGTDPHCTNGDLWSESPPLSPAACADGIDQDGDGFVDYPEDPGCHSSDDSTEDSDTSPCEDGLDGDGDGLIDQSDPDCGKSGGNREYFSCSDGLDNDGDGLADGADAAHCTSPEDPFEVPFLTSCEDGLDNDGDGLFDRQDPDCLSSRFRGEVSTACNNGIDDDGDGSTDAEDSDCLSRSGTSESSKLRGIRSRIAISSDDEFAYVTNKALGQIFVINLAQGTLIDVHNRPPGLGQPLLAAENIRGIPLPSAPLDIAFTNTEVSLDGKISEAETALVTTVDGQLYVIDAVVDNEPVHLLRPFAFDKSSALTPALSISGQPIEQTFSARSDYANLGPFGSNAEELTFHGITLQGAPLAERTETWALTHQGTLPNSSSQSATIKHASDDGLTFTIHDPTANFCSMGVKPGDYFSFRFQERLSCFTEDPLSNGEFEGDIFEYPILRVEQDEIVISRRDGVSVMEWTEDEQPFLSSVGITDRPTYSTQAPGAEIACLGGATSTSIRVPRGVYTVIGSLSGFQHHQSSLDGTCVLSENTYANSSRAFESQPIEGLNLEECPFPLPDDYFSAEFPFLNDAFSFTIRPGCEGIEVTPEITEENPDPITSIEYQIAETPRELRLSFQIISGYQPRRLLIAHIPQRIVTTQGISSVYIVDSGLNRVVQLNPTTLLQGAVID